MNRVFTIIVLIILTQCTAKESHIKINENDANLITKSKFVQGQADLTKFVKVPDKAVGTISEIDSLSNILADRFISIANDPSTETYKEIQSYFKDYKSSQNNEDNIYPDLIQKEHLTVQYIDYANNYGWVEQAADSVFNTSSLTALIFIPAFDNVHKGAVINTKCFKMTLEIYTERNISTDKIYKKKEEVMELKYINL